MVAKLRTQSEIVEYYIAAASERDSASLKERDWLDRAGIRVIKQRTDLSTMRETVHFVSAGRQSVDDIKQHVESWLVLQYRVVVLQFMQSQVERDASTPLSTYFHCVCAIGVS